MTNALTESKRKLHPYCDKGDGKCHRIGGCVCGAFATGTHCSPPVLGEDPNPTLRDLLRALAVMPTHQGMFVCELAQEGKPETLTAHVEVRLIETTDTTGKRKHWNVAAGEYEGQPEAGHG